MDPHLDPLPGPAPGMTRKRGGSRWTALAFLALAAVLVAVPFFFVVGQSEAQPIFALIGTALTVGILLFAAWLSVLAHALGHVLGGLLAGFEFKLLRVRPLAIYNKEGERATRLMARTPDMGFMVVSQPKGTANLTARMGIFYGAGPVASLLLAALLLLGPLPPISWLLLVAFSGTSLLFGLFELLPLTIGSYDTDGKRLLRLLNDETRPQEEAMLRLVAASLDEQRPRDIDRRLPETALSAEQPPAVQAALLRLAYGMALDRGDFWAAREALVAALELWEELPAQWQRVVALEAAYFELARRDDRAAAERWMAAAGEPTGIRSTLEMRAEAALAMADGDEARATDLIIEAIRKLDRSMTPGFAAAEETWLRALQRERNG